LLVFIRRGARGEGYLSRAVFPPGAARGEGRLMLFDLGRLPVFRNKTKSFRDKFPWRSAVAVGAPICSAICFVNSRVRFCRKDAG
jgi:hypothetical protein